MRLTCFVIVAAVCLVQTSLAMPMWYMCDLCESRWLGCIFKCPAERYLNRHQYDGNNVYMGDRKAGRFETKGNMMDSMMESFLKSYTGHEQI